MMMMMAMKPHQMLILLLMLLFVVNLPPCSSEFLFDQPRNVNLLREARRDAHSDKPIEWRVIDVDKPYVTKLVNRAVEQADVTLSSILQAFCKVFRLSTFIFLVTAGRWR